MPSDRPPAGGAPGLRGILEALLAGDVRFIVIGGVAVVLHGHVRATVDIDIVLALDAANVERAISTLEQLGMRPEADVDARLLAEPRIRRIWIEEYGMDVLRLRDDGTPPRSVDVFVKPPLDFERLLSGAASTSIGGRVLRYAGLDDLLTMKRLADRPVDRLDVAALERLRDLQG
jgi:hypothetical protein